MKKDCKDGKYTFFSSNLSIFQGGSLKSCLAADLLSKKVKVGLEKFWLLSKCQPHNASAPLPLVSRGRNVKLAPFAFSPFQRLKPASDSHHHTKQIRIICHWLNTVTNTDTTTDTITTFLQLPHPRCNSTFKSIVLDSSHFQVLHHSNISMEFSRIFIPNIQCIIYDINAKPNSTSKAPLATLFQMCHWLSMNYNTIQVIV